MWWDSKEEEPFVGEVYSGYFRGLRLSGLCSIDTVCGGGQSVTIGFYKFRNSNITDNLPGKHKIDYVWFSDTDIIFYDDIYKPMRNKIMNLHKNDSKEKTIKETIKRLNKEKKENN